MLARVLNMRGVNLELFAFDYDLTWAAFFLNADEQIYGRFGGRDGAVADKYLTLDGLKHAMRAALAVHPKVPKSQPAAGAKPARTVEQYGAAKRLRANACIHCHQAYDFGREELKTAGKWSLDEVWVYPPPQNVGLAVDPNQGDRITSVMEGSATARAGLQTGDVLRSVNGVPVASFADLQYALHRCPAAGRVGIAWQRDGKLHRAELELASGWRKSDISWRESMWGLEPPACVHGRDLDPDEKKRLGLSEKALAFRQANFVPRAAQAAGIQAGDIIVGIDGQALEMTMQQFNAHVRLNYKVGDRITYNLIRAGRRATATIRLPARSD